MKLKITKRKNVKRTYKKKSLRSAKIVVLLLLSLSIPITIFAVQQETKKLHAMQNDLTCNDSSNYQDHEPDGDISEEIINDQSRMLEEIITKYGSAEPEERKNLRAQFLQTAGERKKKLKRLLKKDPEKAYKLIHNDDVWKKLDRVSRNCVEKQTKISGNLEVIITDLEDDTAYEEFYISPDGKQSIFLQPIKKIQGNFISGMTVTATGYQIDNNLIVNNDTPQQLRITGNYGQAIASSQGTQRVAVFLVNFSGQSYSSPDRTSVQNTFDTTVKDYYVKNSYNKTSLISTVYGWISISMAPTCDSYSVTQAVMNATNAQIDFRQIDRVVIYANYPSCGWAGRGTMGKTSRTTPDGYGSYSTAWVDFNGSLVVGTTLHELGHNFGALHSGFRTCDTCSISTYGDVYDAMGRSMYMGQLSAFHREKIGWLDNTTLLEVKSSGSYTIVPLATLEPQVKALKFTVGSASYYLEYRQPLYSDTNLSRVSGTNVFSGALLRRAFIPPQSVDQVLIDASPPASVNSPALAVNGTYQIPGSNINIKVTQATSASLTVEVNIPGTSAITVTPVSAPITHSPTQQPTAVPTVIPTAIPTTQTPTIQPTGSTPIPTTVSPFVCLGPCPTLAPTQIPSPSSVAPTTQPPSQPPFDFMQFFMNIRNSILGRFQGIFQPQPIQPPTQQPNPTPTVNTLPTNIPGVIITKTVTRTPPKVIINGKPQ